MVGPAVKTRFAPSPTGYLHLGNARTALFNALFAYHAGGIFALRIEDTDAERSDDAYIHALMEDLAWLGLDWQEGPERDGPDGPYRQSQRGDIYERYYTALADAGLSYPCFCSQAELERTRAAQRAAGQPPRYPGTCAALTAEEVQRRLDQGLEPAIRFRVPKGETVSFSDAVRGEQRFATDEIGDFIIRRADGTPAFFFTNAVDDALMGITHVLRGEDHLTNTPRQILILRALGLAVATYGHFPLIVGPDGGPLSKRAGRSSLRDLRAEGFLPRALINHLARLGHAFGDDALMDVGGLAAGFELTRIGRAPARHDPAQLAHRQKQAVEAADSETLWEWMRAASLDDGRTVEAMVPEALAMAFTEAVRDNIEMPGDAARLARQVFEEPLSWDDEARQAVEAAGSGLFDTALTVLPTSGDNFQTFAKAVGKAAGVKGKQLFMPLRAALTGLTHGPEMARLWQLWSSEQVRERLQRARDHVA